MKQGRSAYLRPDAQVEPLIDGWYAWTQLVSPAPSAMVVANTHVPTMESYLSAPAVHANAASNPALRGGSFMDLGDDRSADVAELLRRTVEDRAGLLALASGIASLGGQLNDLARGFDLAPLSSVVPDCLRGYVELVYDLHHRPSVRFLESLLYRSPYFDERRQSLDLTVASKDLRPFILSTPRLPAEGHVQVHRPFRDPAVGQLLSARCEPVVVDELADALGVCSSELGTFSALFDHEEPAPAPGYDGDGVRIRYFCHACLLIEHRGLAILTDPLITSNIPPGEARFSYRDLPDHIDYCLITHGHQDHVVLETLLQIRDRIGTLVVPKAGGGALQDPSLSLMMRSLGFSNVVEVDDFDEMALPDGEIIACPFVGEHADLDIRSKSTYVVRLGGRSVLCAADSVTADSSLLRHVHGLTGDVDAVFLGMECDGAPLTWLYGSLFSGPVERGVSQSRRLAGSNADQAIEVVEMFRPRSTYVYAMGAEPWLQHITATNYTDDCFQIEQSDKFVRVCRERGLHAERLFGVKEIWL